MDSLLGPGQHPRGKRCSRVSGLVRLVRPQPTQILQTGIWFLERVLRPGLSDDENFSEREIVMARTNYAKPDSGRRGKISSNLGFHRGSWSFSQDFLEFGF